MPPFSLENIDSHSEKIKTAVLSKSKKVMKYFRRGKQLLEENFIDIIFIFYLFKAVKYIILVKRGMHCKFKKQSRWTFMALSEVYGLVTCA